MWLFARKPAPPPTVPTDLIIPVNYWDDDENTNGLSFDVTFRFDDVLDAAKLRAALSRLLEIGDWRKLGARLRRNAAKKLEYHVPANFDKKRPGFFYESLNYDTNIADHSLASRLPQAGHRPSLFKPIEELKSILRNSDVPDRMEGWLSSDSPQLAIRIITFQDATLLTVTFLHTLMDTMGLHSILQGWSAVLRGQEDEVPILVGFNHDPLAGLSETKPSQPYIFADKLLLGVSWLIFAFHYLFELFWYRKEEERVIFLPAHYLQKMRDTTMGELALQNTGDKKPFVSESDVLFAWWTRIVLRALEPAPSRTIMVRNVFDCRSILAELGHIPSAGAALITNAVFATLTFLSTRQILEEPLSFVASGIRKSLDQQRNMEQLQANVAIQKATLDNAGHPALFGDSGMLMIVCSNWCKSRLFQADFSAAVLSSGIPLSQRANQLGRSSYVNVTGTKTYATRNTGVVIGKDAADNWWLLYTLRAGRWASVEQQLRSMSEKDVN